MGELTKTDNAGKNSPGPVYMFSDNVKYDQVGINDFNWEVINYLSKKILIHYLFTRLQDGHSELKFVLEKINQNMISMRMLCSWMIQLKQIFQEKLEFLPLRSELNLDFKEII